MPKDEILKFIIKNMKSIYNNFKDVYGMKIDEFERTIINFILSFLKLLVLLYILMI